MKNKIAKAVASQGTSHVVLFILNIFISILDEISLKNYDNRQEITNLLERGVVT